MTIRRGEAWGHPVQRPSDLRIVASDRELAMVLSGGATTSVSVSGGDMYRTLGAHSANERTTMQQLPVDLLRVSLGEGRSVDAVAHVVARAPRWRGSWWRGDVLIVMNAQFMGAWNLAPRGHPNDGVAEVLQVDPGLGVRQRWMAARRARYAAHIPHPEIHSERITSRSWEFDRPLEIRADGRRVGHTDQLTVEVLPDAAVVYV